MVDGIGATRRHIIDHLKRMPGSAVRDLASSAGITTVGARQHLNALESQGLAESTIDEPVGRGRPATLWALTPLADELFPDHHDELTVELIDAVRVAGGEDGLARVLNARTARQLESLERTLPRQGLTRKVEALAEHRTKEGYLAEMVDNDDDLLLIEHHCPVRAAAASCDGLCRAELELFRTALGGDVTVERTEHALAGDTRCVYRIARLAN